MHFAELPHCSPAEFLAWDEGFLDAAENGVLRQVLWFWESPAPFVVLGYGQSRQREVDLEAAARDNVPVLRRCSGGGAVVQGPGCLNYGVLLPIEAPPAPTSSITETNHWVMQQTRSALQPLFTDPVVIRGHTDLALKTEGRELKFSGNAQRRRRQFLVFHGTVLLNFDLALISRYLKFPSLEPEYRAGRSHSDFVVNTHRKRSQVVEALKTTWAASEPLQPLPDVWMRGALESRYSKVSWHERA